MAVVGKFIITGASSGIGLALAKAALDAGFEVLGIARHEPKELEGVANFSFEVADLTSPTQLEQLPLTPAAHGPTILVNNAGWIGPVNSASTYTWDDTDRCMTLNVTAPMRLTARFLAEVSGEKQIYFTGSGAATYPIEGWAAYCASKSAIHQYAEVLAKEHPNMKVHAFRPGKVDTPMQAEIRNSSADGFPMHGSFVDAFEQGELVRPETVAEAILRAVLEPLDLPVIFSISEI